MLSNLNETRLLLRTTRRPGAEARVSLAQRRRWFADEDDSKSDDHSSTDGQKPDTDKGDVPADLADLVELIKKDPITAALTVKNLRAEAKKHRTDKEAADAARAEQERKRLADEKKYEELSRNLESELNGLKPRAQRAEAMETYLTNAVKTRIGQIPEAFRDLVPDYDDPLKTIEWLDKNQTKLQQQRAPDMGAGQGGSGGGGSTTLTDEERQMAQRLGVSPADYAKMKQASVTSK